MGSKLTSFFCGVSKLTLFWGRGIEMTCLWGRSKLILLLCAGRLSFGFHVWIEMNLVSVYGPKLTYFSVLIDWLRFCGGGWICFDFIVGDRTWLDFSVGVGIDLFFVWGRKWLGFSFWIEIDLVWVSGSKLTCFLCGDGNWLGYCVHVENILILVFGSKMTWFMWGIELDLLSV